MEEDVVAGATAPAAATFYATLNQGAALTKALHALAHLAAGTALAFDFDEAQGLTVTVAHLNVCVTLLRVPRASFARWHGGGRRAISLCLGDKEVLKHLAVPKSAGKTCAVTFAAVATQPDQLEVYFYAASVDATSAAARAAHGGALVRVWLTDDHAAAVAAVEADFEPTLSCELAAGALADAVADLNGRDCTNAGFAAGAAGAGGGGGVVMLRGLVDRDAVTANVEIGLPAKNVHRAAAVVAAAAATMGEDGGEAEEEEERRSVFAVVYLKLIADVLTLDAKATVALRTAPGRLHVIAGCGAALPGATLHAHLRGPH